ncbi:hypothetical protein [Streptomyces sp. NPDC089799]|uniref:hypothetical protein n=1 Tax=Streptomyces sp. NPDC089799 TaxID=3155066 RepID=UPI00342F1C42
MPAPYATTVTFTTATGEHNMTRAQVEAAASRLTPAHGNTALDYSWYALAGTGLHYVGALVKEASNVDVKVGEARTLLHDLGFQIMAFMFTRESVSAPHPCHQ